jgi:DNA polymerase III subunit epsilon
MFENDGELAALAEALVRSGNYRVLRRLVPRTTSVPSADQVCRTGVIIDLETTGLDQQKDEIIELGMVKFDYLPDGSIAGLRDVFTSFNQPSGSIPEEVTALPCEEAQKWDPNSDDSNALMSHEEIRSWWGPERRRS